MLKKIGFLTILSAFLFLLGGCTVQFPLLDVAAKGGLQFEPYRPPVIYYEPAPSYFWGGSGVWSYGDYKTLHGNRWIRDKKGRWIVERTWEPRRYRHKR